MQGFIPGYRISKAAMNALTRILAGELKMFGHRNVLVNSVCPGWLKTDMGGENAPRTVQQGAEVVLYAATLPEGGPSGQFLVDNKPIAW